MPRLTAGIFLSVRPYKECEKPGPSLLIPRYYVDISRHMDKINAIDALAALAQTTRLDAFRLLMRHQPTGLPAGDIARMLDVPHNTLSTHMAALQRAGLVLAERQSRSIVYRASLDGLRELVAYLLKDCCDGHPDLCGPLIADLAPCCAPKELDHA
jgi:DNA-binding transcriptional ArsR family regulator